MYIYKYIYIHEYDIYIYTHIYIYIYKHIHIRNIFRYSSLVSSFMFPCQCPMHLSVGSMRKKQRPTTCDAKAKPRADFGQAYNLRN